MEQLDEEGEKECASRLEWLEKSVTKTRQTVVRPAMLYSLEAMALRKRDLAGA